MISKCSIIQWLHLPKWSARDWLYYAQSKLWIMILSLFVLLNSVCVFTDRLISDYCLLYLRFVCPSNCSGKGVCDYSLEVPSCVCFNKADRSASCDSDLPPQSIQPTLSPSKLFSENPSMVPSYIDSNSNPEMFTQNRTPSFEDNDSSSVSLVTKTNFLCLVTTKIVFVILFM